MYFKTTQEHEKLRADIREWAEKEIKPYAFMLDQNNQFPKEQIKDFGKRGYLGLPYPKEYGGMGKDILSYAIGVEELSRVDGGTGVILSAHVSLGAYPIFAYGTEEQKQKYLVPLAKGEKLGAFGLTEPNAGSDAGGTETTAEHMGDHYLYYQWRRSGYLCRVRSNDPGYRNQRHQRLYRGKRLGRIYLR